MATCIKLLSKNLIQSFKALFNLIKFKLLIFQNLNHKYEFYVNLHKNPVLYNHVKNLHLT